MMPVVPAKNIATAFHPKFKMPLMSMLNVSRAKLAGNRYLEAIYSINWILLDL